MIYQFQIDNEGKTYYSRVDSDTLNEAKAIMMKRILKGYKIKVL